jgi:DNA repair exonuclease SbcCD nuclease subunit
LRFLHTADWQIGMRALQAGEKAEAVRAERLAAARRVVQVAKEHQAEFILVAGDTFEDNGVERELIRQTATILDQAGMPVYVIPGNHDPLVPGSVWDHPCWAAAGQVRILRTTDPQPLPGGLLHPCPVLCKHSDRDPTLAIKADRSQGIQIGLAHGSVPEIVPDQVEYPIPIGAPARIGLDYLALGHWHSYHPFDDPAGAKRMAYCGTHETTAYGERDSGNVLLVQITQPGTPPEITSIRTGGLRWVERHADLRQREDLEQLIRELDGLADRNQTLLRLVLHGVLSTDQRVLMEQLRKALGGFFSSQLDEEGLRPAPDDPTWVENIPPGILRTAASRLRDWADPAFAGMRPEGVTPEVAAAALIEFYALREGGER